MTKSTKKLNETKKEVLAIEKKRKNLIGILFEDCELIEGSYTEFLGRCGHDNCHCKENPCHFITKISWYENGKFKKNKIVRLEDREWVKKQAKDYQIQKKALGHLVKLNENEKKALQKILKMKSKKYE
jgi:hypothetical protein